MKKEEEGTRGTAACDSSDLFDLSTFCCSVCDRSTSQCSALASAYTGRDSCGGRESKVKEKGDLHRGSCGPGARKRTTKSVCLRVVLIRIGAGSSVSREACIESGCGMRTLRCQSVE